MSLALDRRGPVPAPVTDVSRDLDFNRLLIARVASTTGSALTTVALPVLLYQRSGSAVATASVAAAAAGPYLLFGLVAGAVGDRSDRKRLMVSCDLIAAVALATVPLASWAGRLSVLHLIAVAWAVGSISVWFDAVNFGAVPALVHRDHLLKANARIWSWSSLIQIAAPAAAGVIIAAAGPSSAIAIDAASFVLSALLVAHIKRPMNSSNPPSGAAGSSLASDVAEGICFLLKDRVIRLFTGLGAINGACGGAVLGTLVIYADRSLGIASNDGRVGLLFAASGVGAYLSTLLLGRLSDRFRPEVLTLGGMAAGAASLAGLALGRNIPLAALFLALWGLSSMLVIINGMTVRQLRTPDRLQGRVNVVGRMVTFGVGQPLGAMAAGWAAAIVPLGVVFGALAVLLLTAVALGALPAREPAPDLAPHLGAHRS